MKKIILNCVPPFACNMPSPAMSILKSWLTKNGHDSSVIYWNMHLYKLQSDFVWNKPSTFETSSQLGLYVNYMLNKSKDSFLINCFKKIIQCSSPRYLTDDPLYYDMHMAKFADKMDDVIDTILSEIDFSETLMFGFSLKLDGWIFSSIVAEKVKKIAPEIPILVGGISTKEKAKSLLENFTQFDMAMWGEGEEPLVKVVEMLKKGKNNYSELINTAYRSQEGVLFSENKNNYYIDLSEQDMYPDYSDYFKQKKKLKLDIESILPIEGSRGCHWNKCKFCYLNSDYRYRVKSCVKICAEIKYMMNKFQLFSFEFLDNDFIGADLNKANLLIDNLILLKKEEPRFKIVIAEVITKGLNHSIIKRMFDAGIIFVQIGYESTSHKLLRKIRKKNTFASNLFYVKIASLYKIPLGNVNVLVNMPDETIEDILESIDNLRFLRFFLNPIYFKHMLIPVQVDSSSRYYLEVKNKTSGWTPSALAYDFLQNYILEKDHWIIFDYVKQSRHYQWETFKNIERYYLENKHTYSIKKESGTIEYLEYINGRKISEFNFCEDSVDWLILCYANDMVVSLQDLYIYMRCYLSNDNIDKKKLQSAVEDLMRRGLIYHTPDFSEIVSIINTSMI